MSVPLSQLLETEKQRTLVLLHPQNIDLTNEVTIILSLSLPIAMERNIKKGLHSKQDEHFEPAKLNGNCACEH